MPEAVSLKRVVGLPGAVALGLGSILGTGIFVSVGLAAGEAGPGVVLAVALAAGVALLNGLSSAQLAASYPVSGGTYEYGHRVLNPLLGFIAGWMFLCAKSASAATAALGFAGYALGVFGVAAEAWRVPLALAAVALLTLVTAGGMGRSSRVNASIVGFTLLALLTLVALGLRPALAQGAAPFRPFIDPSAGPAGLLHAAALMFVAYTGYGRIATLGEEVREPQRTIPRAIILTMALTALLYAAVAWVGVAVTGAADFAAAARADAAPLALVARRLDIAGLEELVAIAAVTAMLGVLLNLLLGLSRVLLAMARRGDMPGGLARVDEDSASPRRAVIAIGVLIAGLALLGDVKLTWSFSALTVLVYYAITNLAALRLPREQRRYPRWAAALGLLSCLSLTLWLEPAILGAFAGVLAAGLVWRAAMRRYGASSASSS